MNNERKRELIHGLNQDLERYIQRTGLIQEFIDSTCQDDEEIQFIKDCEWWVTVVGEE